MARDRNGRIINSYIVVPGAQREKIALISTSIPRLNCRQRIARWGGPGQCQRGRRRPALNPLATTLIAVRAPVISPCLHDLPLDAWFLWIQI
jgi:hypothetical protein